ncbi:MAG: aminoacyl-tRNA hydrolase [Woeseiaceae bacterium]|jgi:PTH1 family peptidyl-tRNA hydrolase|tara:strand:+ start:57 stop:650 length:594 start_codon:yes stop_codon:yes gene_type:complete
METHLLVIAGLGNPGKRYERTLHNAGFWCIDDIAARHNAIFSYNKKFDAEICQITIATHDIWLIKPQSFMNMSGGPIRAALDYYRIPPDKMLVIHDEIDLSPGVTKLKMGGGHGGHNGLRDIFNHCDRNFMRIRIGIGHPGHKDEVINYVLCNATQNLEIAINESIKDVQEIITIILEQGIESAMKKLHTPLRLNQK